jgi:transcriptional regulator with XRE-family HTH domain
MIAICRRQRVKVLLAERDLMARDAAAQLGITPGVFSQVTNGRTTAWPSLRVRMSELFDVPESDLFDLR